MNPTRTLRPALVLLAIFTMVCGLLYPLAVTSAANVFAKQRQGSLVVAANGQIVGSKLVGQSFTKPGHFWGRPSATSPAPYDAGSSSGSNLGPSNPALRDAIRERVQALKAADPEQAGEVPVDLVSASGSGLDPDISPAAAYYQVHRVAIARGLDESKVRALVDANVEGRFLGIFGEPHVSALLLNQALDALAGGASAVVLEGAASARHETSASAAE
ncbi:MAG: potassium-transporting ATPase subunit KdpC [Polyangiaceae bacterium]